MKNKIKVIIVLVCLCIILLGSIMFKNFSKDKKVDNKDENDKIIANEIGDSDNEYVSLQVGDNFDLKKYVTSKYEVNDIESFEIIDYDKNAFSIKDDYIISSIIEGTYIIKFKFNDIEDEVKIISNVETSNVEFDDNATQFDLTNCDLGMVLSDTSSKYQKKGYNITQVSMNRCIKNYKFGGVGVKKTRAMQNFAITNNYVYFSGTFNQTWEKSSNCKSLAVLKKLSRQIITRTTKTGNEQQFMLLSYAGHAQSFDVLTNSNDDDIIYTNAFAYTKNNKSRPSSKSCGTMYRGVLFTNFTPGFNTEQSKVPGYSIAIKKDYDLNVIASEDYNNDLTSYYNNTG